jgi:hypothetical protein
MQGRTFDRPADQRTVHASADFTRREWAAIRVAAARAGMAVRIWLHNVAASAALNPPTQEFPMQPDTKTPAGEAAAKATLLRAITAPDVADPTRVDELAKRQPCAGRPEPFAPPASSFKTD